MSENQIVKVTRNSDEEWKIDSISSLIKYIKNYEPEILLLIGSFFEEVIPNYDYALLYIDYQKQLIQIKNRRFVNYKIIYNYHFNWDYPFDREEFTGNSQIKNIYPLSQNEQYYANMAPFSFKNDIIRDYMNINSDTGNFWEDLDIDYYY
tara:strand:- start:86 stop:535 length:450 start_codon:yes stop_codon:yes gene_type:complete